MKAIGRFLNSLSVKIIGSIVVLVTLLIILIGILSYQVFTNALLNEISDRTLEVAEFGVNSVADWPLAEYLKLGRDTIYEYEFNDECFSSCDEAKNDYGYNIKNKTGSSEHICICENLWITNNDGKKECITEKFCNKTYYLLIESTKECKNSDTCSSGYKFNGVCYGTCPNNTIKNEGTHECECLRCYCQ